jgi:hypothetical protein
MPHLPRRRPSAAMVVALLALFVALDGPATAARLIDGGSIKQNSITNRQVRNHTLGTRDLSARAVRALRATPSRSVGAKQVRDGAIGPKALAAKAVDGSKIADGAVGSADLAGKAVDGSKIADGAVGSSQLGGGAVTPSKVADGAIAAAAVADGGLQTRDLGDFYGSVSVDFNAFGPSECKFALVASPQPSAPGAGNSIADDVVSVSPSTSGWPDPIMVVANPGAQNTIRIIACRIGGDAGTTIDPPPTTFFYVAFDTP